MNADGLPWATEHVADIARKAGRREPAFFLDFDGTLAPLVSHPDLARLPARTRDVLLSVSRRHLLCVVSGRGLSDLRTKVDIDSLYYAADHGHRIVGPTGSGIDVEIEGESAGTMLAAATELERRLQDVAGVVVEAKEFTLSVHYRMVAETDRPLVRRTVDHVAGLFPDLRLTEGKMVRELRPSGSWNKGRAVLWLLDYFGWKRSDVFPICVGDDRTDEDMFAVAEGRGVSIVVGDPEGPTRADYRLRDCDEAATLLEVLATGVDVKPSGIG